MNKPNKTTSGEREYKMESLANIQFKFSTIDDPVDIITKLLMICDLMSIKYSFPPDKYQIEDTYFDDYNLTLYNHKCSIRKRIQNGKIMVTLKAEKIKSLSPFLERLEKEIECSEEECEMMKQNNFKDEISNVFENEFRITISHSQLKEVIQVFNERTRINFETSISKYSFSFDKYCYKDKDDLSEFFGEIEIEKEGEYDNKEDEKLDKLIKSISTLTGYTHYRKSKFEKGIEWSLNKGKDWVTVHCIMFDIVDFSLLPTNIQKQTIQTLNHLTKETIKNFRCHNIKDIIYIPTGDGMVIVFDHSPQHIIPYIFDIQESVKKHNEIYPRLKFRFRTGIHSGPVFKYSDVNGNLNFAGNGINLVPRVTNIGNEWHILASKDAYEHIAKVDNTRERYCHELPQDYPVKHNIIIKLYNIYDDLGHGNKTLPKVDK